jgi:Predicted membrane protein involved in D-alanine export
MLLGGFWHGASWNFIIWGALHGIGLAIHKIWMILTGNPFRKFNNSRWYNAIALLITFHFICFGWVFFKAENYETANTMLNQIANNFSFDVWRAFYSNYHTVIWIMALAFILHSIPDSYADKLLDRYHRVPLWGYMTIFFLFVLLYGYFKSSEPVMPIYLQF